MNVGEVGSLYPAPPATITRSLSFVSRRVGRAFPTLHGLYKQAKYTPYYSYGSLADPYERRVVDPAAIETYWEGNLYYFNLEAYGEIVTGDWDQQTAEIATHRKFRSIRQHFEEGVPWEETPIYQFLERHIETEGPIDGVASQADLDERYERLDETYHAIKQQGYRSQRELQGDRFDEICVSIGRDGEVIFNASGWHRLSIAKVLGIDEIPVSVLLRHKEWQDRREAIYRGEDQAGDHPDLRDLTARGSSSPGGER